MFCEGTVDTQGSAIESESRPNLLRIADESPPNPRRMIFESSVNLIHIPVPFQKASTKSSPSITYFQETSTRFLAFPKNVHSSCRWNFCLCDFSKKRPLAFQETSSGRKIGTIAPFQRIISLAKPAGIPLQALRSGRRLC